MLVFPVLHYHYLVYSCVYVLFWMYERSVHSLFIFYPILHNLVGHFYCSLILPPKRYPGRKRGELQVSQPCLATEAVKSQYNKF